jgi:hypothetical protein
VTWGCLRYFSPRHRVSVSEVAEVFSPCTWTLPQSGKSMVPPGATRYGPERSASSKTRTSIRSPGPRVVEVDGAALTWGTSSARRVVPPVPRGPLQPAESTSADIRMERRR